MTKKQKEGMYKQIEKHGRDLLAIFPNATITDPVKLCKALRRLEVKAHKAATDYCNTGDQNCQEYGDHCAELAGDILGKPLDLVRVVFNGDARGYALKIDNEPNIPGYNDGLPVQIQIYQDWGGYGIIAPDFTPEVK